MYKSTDLELVQTKHFMLIPLQSRLRFYLYIGVLPFGMVMPIGMSNLGLAMWIAMTILYH